MKRLLMTVFVLLALTLPALAVDLTFRWDAMPTGQNWTNVRLYQVSGTTYTLKGTAAGNATTLTITGFGPGSYTFIARSVVGSLESVDSNTASKDIVPDTPGNFRIVAVEIAPDGTVTFRLLDPAEFFRS